MIPPGKSHLTCAYKVLARDGVVPAKIGNPGEYVCGCLNPDILKKGKYPTERITFEEDGVSLKRDVAILSKFKIESHIIPNCVEIMELQSTDKCTSCKHYSEEFRPEIYAGSITLTDGTRDF